LRSDKGEVTSSGQSESNVKIFLSLYIKNI